jgi:ATP-dependent RNA helicase RhlE
VDILVATPGRLLDHMGQNTVDLSKVDILVLDEADRMLDMGFIPDIRRIVEKLPKQRQNLFFSATFSREIRQFADSFLNSPTEIAVARHKETGELIKQMVHPVDKGNKRALLSWLIGSGDWQQVLIFTRTKHGANRLADQLGKDGISASAIHGNKSQGARTKALADFKRGTVRALVATDIAARGLDIKELPHVVNYELPNVPEDYVHRIGRTGRAGSNGVALSLVCREEKPLLSSIEKLTRNHIESIVVSGFEPGTRFAKDEETEADTRRGQPRSGDRNKKRTGQNQSGARKTGARSGQPAKKGGRGAHADSARSGTRSGRNGSNDQSGNPAGAKKRSRRRSNKGNTSANAARTRESAPASGGFQNALRAVTGIFGGTSRSR